MDALEKLERTGTEPRHKWETGDAATIRLEKPADLATAIFSVPYWREPLEGIANMYNHLTPGGVMAIATGEYLWTQGIRYANCSPDEPKLRPLAK